jgi:hypothetical protein
LIRNGSQLVSGDDAQADINRSVRKFPGPNGSGLLIGLHGKHAWALDIKNARLTVAQKCNRATIKKCGNLEKRRRNLLVA